MIPKMIKKTIFGAATLATAVCLSLTPAGDFLQGGQASESCVMAATRNGWEKEGENWYYYQLGKKQYLTTSIGGNLYFFDGTTGALTTGFVTYANYTYYFRPIVNDIPKNCYAVKNWLVLDGKKYYFDSSYHMMKKTWYTIGTDQFYFDEDGVCATGWQKIGDKWYEFDSGSGAKLSGPVDQPGGSSGVQNGWVTENDKRYYYKSGVKQTGWLYLEGQYFYLGSDGVMRTGWQQVGKKWYYLDGSGVMKIGWFQDTDGLKFYLNPDGSMCKGWKQIDGKWYYFKSSGACQTGWKTLKGVTYYFHKDGIMAESEWVNGYRLDAGGAWTYPNRATWRKSAKGWWYGDKAGWYAANGTLVIDREPCKFNAEGYWVE